MRRYMDAGPSVERAHPDAGLTTMRYDLAGNLLEKVTAQIRRKYHKTELLNIYDHERLTDIDYPRQYQNKVNILMVNRA